MIPAQRGLIKKEVKKVNTAATARQQIAGSYFIWLTDISLDSNKELDRLAAEKAGSGEYKEDPV